MRRIRLVVNVPIGNQHGMTKGRVLEVVHDDRGEYVFVRGVRGAVFVRSDDGGLMGLFPTEFEDVLGLEPTLPPPGGWWTPICVIDGVATGVY